MKTITASDANRQFSKVLREVSQGKTITVLSRGREVATIAPARVESRGREAAKRGLVERLRRERVTGQRDWSREELYD